MKFTSLKTQLSFTGAQRSGILALFSIIIILQWLLLTDWKFSARAPIDVESLAIQKQIDSLRDIDVPKKRYPFNPNYISDHKGYMLGMSVAEIDKLHAFREKGQFVNSAREFQKVTGVSDSLLLAISPMFKFPDWVYNKAKTSYKKGFSSKPALPVLDINQATAADLVAVYGIGPAISERILKQRELLGGFASMAHMSDVWGLSPEVLEKLNQQFSIKSNPELKKININKASMKELSAFPYFRYPLSKDIVTYRSMNGEIKNSEDLIKIRNFPVEKVDRIAVYLEF